MKWILVTLLLVGCASVDISPEELTAMDQEAVLLVDVHVPEQEHIPGTDRVIPYTEVLEANLPMDETIVLYCRSGSMSSQAVQQLRDAGYKNVYNLEGGKNAWDTR